MMDKDRLAKAIAIFRAMPHPLTENDATEGPELRQLVAEMTTDEFIAYGAEVYSLLEAIA